MSLTLKAATVLFAAFTMTGDVAVTPESTTAGAPKCAAASRPAACEKQAAGTAAECDPKCEPECDPKCPPSEQASCEKPKSASSSPALLTCARK